MKNIILFPIIYLLNFIKINKVKSIAIGLIILLTPILNSIEDRKEVTHVIKEFKHENNFCYLYYDDGNLEMKTGTTPFKLTKNNNIIEYKYNDANVFVWIVYVICFLMVVVGIFANDDEMNYELGKVFSRTVSFFTKCEVEDGKFYYYFGDKLIGESNHKRNDSNIAKYYDVTSLTVLNNCPEWKSIQRKRENILNKLGI
jgi:hypothetical protein